MQSERRDIISDMLCNKPFISLRELEERFPNVSGMTLRRDIEYFEKRGDAIKVRGGARSMKFITTCFEGKFSMRMNEQTDEKQKIALAASKLLEKERSVFLDSGTTILKLASVMPDERIVITTSGPNIAIELMKKKLPIVNIVGGMVNRDSLSVSGGSALKLLSEINIDTAFIVASGMSAGEGLTCGNYSECEFKRAVMERARRTIILVDSSKVDKTLPYTFSSFDHVDTIVTDAELPADIADILRKRGIKVVVA